MANRQISKGVGGIYHYYKLNHSSSRSWRLLCKPVCASTEIELTKWIENEPVLKNQPRAIFASRQKFGKGQFSRNWHSPKGGVWASAAIKSEGSHEKSAQLFGLAVAFALVERFELKGINVKIKWPNDLMVNGQKLAGVLPKLFFRGEDLRLLRVGIGLNVINNVPIEGISLKKILGSQKIDVNFWSSEVLSAIERSIDLIDNKQYLCYEVEKRLWSKNFMDVENSYQWDIKGISENGGLILLNKNRMRILSRNS